MNGFGVQLDSPRAGEALVGDDRNERSGILHRLEEGGNTGQSAGRRTRLHEWRDTRDSARPVYLVCL